MNSMTGYGEASAENQRYRISISLRAVNNRFLDLKLRLPEEHRARERELERQLRRRLHRGRVEARFTIQTVAEPETRVRLRSGALAALRQEIDRLAERGLLDGRLAVSDLVRIPGLIEIQGEPPEWTDDDGELLRATAGAALDQLLEGRRAEGERLRQSLEQRLTGLDELVERLEERWPEIRRQAHADLSARLEALEGDARVDEQRLAQEVALLVERGDVREELDRLVAHLAHFRELLTAEGSLGKRLDFLSQEILRELNTTGAKCRDVQIVRWVLDGKLLCEQLREQIQNVE